MQLPLHPILGAKSNIKPIANTICRSERRLFFKRANLKPEKKLELNFRLQTTRYELHYDRFNFLQCSPAQL